MPQNAIIRGDGSGDYTSIQAWVVAENVSDYNGEPTVGVVDDFFDLGTDRVDLAGAWPNGLELRAPSQLKAFNGTERRLCGLSSTDNSMALRNRGYDLKLDGLELYNDGEGYAYWNTTTGGNFNAVNCLFKDFDSRFDSAVEPGTIDGPGLVNCVISSLSRAYTPEIRMDRCTVLFDSVGSAGTNSNSKIISNTFSGTSNTGECFRLDVVQTNNASTDGTAIPFTGIKIEDNFISPDPVSSGDYRINDGSFLGISGIGAFITTQIAEGRLVIKDMMASVASVAANLIGERLSRIGNGPSELPSVFIANSKPPKPAFPYATVAHITTRSLGRDLQNKRYMEESGGFVSTYSKEVLLRINFYGGVEDDSATIADEFRDRLFLDGGFDLFRSQVGFPLMDVTDVNTFSAVMNTDFQEVASIDIRVAAATSYEDNSSGFVEEIAMDDGLISLDGAQIDADVSATSNNQTE